MAPAAPKTETRGWLVLSLFHTPSSLHITTPLTLAPRTELDAAVLAYLAKRGFSRAAKAFEKEAGTKASGAEDLEKAWKLLSG